MRTRFRARTLGLVMASGLIFTACSGPAAGDSTEPVEGGTLVFGAGGPETTCLDPVIGGYQTQAALATQYLEQLFYQDAEGAIHPWLAQEWGWAEDRMSLDVTVRDDITFSDGSPLDAETVVANVEYIKDPDTMAGTATSALENVEGAEAVDDDTARIIMSAPDNGLLEHFAQPWVPIQSKEGLARGTDENCQQPIGTGPFKIESWTQQQQVELTRNENHITTLPAAQHEGAPYLETVIWRFMPDDATRFAALQSGEVDLIDNLQPQHEQQIDSLDAIESAKGARPGAPNYIGFNTTKAPFDDVKVREAFVRSVDVDAAIQSAFFDKYERTNAMLATVTQYSLQDPEAFAQDPERANTLLEEAGWTERDAEGFRTKDGERLSADLFLTNNFDVPVPIAEQFQASAEEVGFEITIQELDYADYSQRVNASEHDAASAAFTKNSPAVLNTIMDRDVTQGNIVKYQDDAFNELLFEAQTTGDDAERASLYEEIQQTAYDQYLALPLYDRRTAIGHSSDVKGTTLLSPVTLTYLGDTWVAE